MLLEVVLAQTDANLGPKGSKILINDSYIVAIKKNDDGKAVLFVDLSDLGKFTEVYVEESYESWYMLRLNV